MNRADRRRGEARSRANTKMRALVSAGRLAAMARETQAEVDAWQSANMNPDVKCSEGCSACCYLPVYIEIAEAHAIVASFPDEVARALPQLLEQQRRLAEVVSPQDLADLRTVERGPDAMERIGDVYTDLHMPCPFLGDDQRCSIYAARPIPCRTHFAVGDPAGCVDGHARQFLWNTPERLAAPGRLMHRVATATGGTVSIGLLQSTVLRALKGQPHKSLTNTLAGGKRFALR
jgi:Fe-S-cluster containining protein